VTVPSLWAALRGGPDGNREISRFSFDQYARMRDLALTAPWSVGSGGRTVEQIENSFTTYCQAAYKSDGVVFATVLARMLLFGEARFQFQRLTGGRPGGLFGTAGLALLEEPWPNGSTGELLSRMEQDVSLSGNAYVVSEGDRLRRLRPDWVTIVLSAPPETASSVDVIGYRYHPGGPGAGDFEAFTVDEIAHWSPIPDPEALYRGMSWLTPVLREVQGDRAATEHKLKFFENGATLGAVVSPKETLTPEQFKQFVSMMDGAHKGVENAYTTAYVSAGVDVSLVGADMKQLDFKATQGAGETRIAAAGGVPAIIVGLSEGLASATYSNYGMARRKFGDHWARPQWRSACAALAKLVDVPTGARLWYDDRDIAFLREDRADVAKIQQAQAATIRSLIDAAFEPDTVVAAVDAEDWSLLKHSGLSTVQVQPEPLAGGTKGKA
jgi:phage portal protein BeeE